LAEKIKSIDYAVFSKDQNHHIKITESLYEFAEELIEKLLNSQVNIEET